jgi:hypothetical protein
MLQVDSHPYSVLSDSRRHVERGSGKSASLPKLGIGAVIDVLSLLSIAILRDYELLSYDFTLYFPPLFRRFKFTGQNR